jgi:hypothetical protein
MNKKQAIFLVFPTTRTRNLIIDCNKRNILPIVVMPDLVNNKLALSAFPVYV